MHGGGLVITNLFVWAPARGLTSRTTAGGCEEALRDRHSVSMTIVIYA